MRRGFSSRRHLARSASRSASAHCCHVGIAQSRSTPSSFTIAVSHAPRAPSRGARAASDAVARRSSTSAARARRDASRARARRPRRARRRRTAPRSCASTARARSDAVEAAAAEVGGLRPPLRELRVLQRRAARSRSRNDAASPSKPSSSHMFTTSGHAPSCRHAPHAVAELVAFLLRRSGSSSRSCGACSWRGCAR